MQNAWDQFNIRFLSCSGVEQTAAEGRHVHVALVLGNATSKASVIRKFVLNKKDGYYVEPRDREKGSLQQWLEYHRKSATKINPAETVLLELGQLPRQRTRDLPREERDAIVEERTNERYMKWMRRMELVKAQEWTTLDREFPGFRWSSAGQNMIRECLKQSEDEYTRPLSGPLNNYIIWGPTGTGKSSSVSLLFPNAYKKQKGSQYWDAYDRTNPEHAVVWIDEFSKETLKTIAGKPDGGFEFLKELGDRYPVTVDEKYTKGYKIRPKSILITMNEHPTSLLPKRAVEVNKAALFRKFKILHVTEWLALNGLECVPGAGCRFITT